MLFRGAAVPNHSVLQSLEKAAELYAWGGPEDIGEIISLLRTAAEASREAGDFETQVLASERLSKVYADVGMADSALALLVPLLQSSMALRDADTELRLRTRLALVHERAGAAEPAAQLAREAAVLAGRARDTMLVRQARRTYTRIWALRLLGRTPLADLSMGVEQGEAFVLDVEDALSVVGEADSLGSVEEATARLEDLLSNVTVRVRVRSEPANATVRYRRYVDRGLPAETIRTNAEIRTSPAYFVFTLVDRRSGMDVDSIAQVCRTDCEIDFGSVSP